MRRRETEKMEWGGVGRGEGESDVDPTYSLATDNISSLWLCGKAKIWRQPEVSSPVYANGPQ